MTESLIVSIIVALWNAWDLDLINRKTSRNRYIRINGVLTFVGSAVMVATSMMTIKAVVIFCFVAAGYQMVWHTIRAFQQWSIYNIDRLLKQNGVQMQGMWKSHALAWLSALRPFVDLYLILIFWTLILRL